MLRIADKTFNSHLFTGTGKFASSQLMVEAIRASGSQLVTLAMKRVDLRQHNDAILMPLIEAGVTLLPNTSGAKTAEEAIFAAQLAREALGTHWLKLEIHPDARWLLPDPIETLKAAEALVKQGFVVLPYCGADPVLCKRLEEVGCAAVMPLEEVGCAAVMPLAAWRAYRFESGAGNQSDAGDYYPAVHRTGGGRRRDRRPQPRDAGAGNGRRCGTGQHRNCRGG
ncbi:Thiazole biosynthesis protein ThiG [Salmonella enterica subsp. enterica serovar Montevideo str. S5-403]|uniref:thiazole synthase n=1 Tax=Salmonella enterica subsp. enterica serovar Montevideo str. S5-403 TaxID=913242 RepID=G5QBA0_SALMO|nr:Thiazole biosynthesis protein ThiG [Salmonella enterica subsp. enterica serovar Montevideo str. S5-403]